jgi:hypothetical protein
VTYYAYVLSAITVPRAHYGIIIRERKNASRAPNCLQNKSQVDPLRAESKTWMHRVHGVPESRSEGIGRETKRSSQGVV